MSHSNEVLIEVDSLKKYYRLGNHQICKGVDNVSFSIRKGEIFSLAGESGSGKSTIAKCLIGIQRPTEGEIFYRGKNISKYPLDNKTKAELRKGIQIVFQDPISSMSPRMTVKKILEEPLKIGKLCNGEKERHERIKELLSIVGLKQALLERYPSELSGGQNQRICIARAIASEPDFLIADEPVASLDVSVRSQIIELFQSLNESKGLTILFIAHDLPLIGKISSRIGIMRHGKMVEIGDAKEIYKNPENPYTKALISSVPIPDPVLYRRRKLGIHTPRAEAFHIQSNI